MKRMLRSMMSVLLLAGAMPLLAIENGKPAPDFTLQDINGNEVSLSDYKGEVVVLEWINHGCPFVKKHYDAGNMQALQKEFTAKDVVWVSICSSAEGKQGHMTPDEWVKMDKEKEGAASAILLDASGKVGKQYGAKTTPHMYIVNPDGILIYQGAIDDTPSADSADIKGAVNYVREALNESLDGKPVTTSETKAYGCSVKYK